MSAPLFEKLMTKEQLAEHLGISESYVAKLMAKEGLPFFKIGRSVRFRLDDVSAWLQKRKAQ